MRVANLAVKFLIELAAVAAVGYAGAVLGGGLWAVVLAAGLPLSFIGAWGRWNAPRSTHRLPTSARVVLELAMFALAALALLAAGAGVLGVVLIAVVVVNAMLMTVLHQWQE